MGWGRRRSLRQRLRGVSGDLVTLRFLRSGEIREAKVVMREPRTLVPLVDYERDPDYRIYAGLVFQNLTVHHLADLEQAPPHLAEYMASFS